MVSESSFLKRCLKGRTNSSVGRRGVDSDSCCTQNLAKGYLDSPKHHSITPRGCIWKPDAKVLFVPHQPSDMEDSRFTFDKAHRSHTKSWCNSKYVCERKTLCSAIATCKLTAFCNKGRRLPRMLGLRALYEGATVERRGPGRREGGRGGTGFGLTVGIWWNVRFHKARD